MRSTIAGGWLALIALTCCIGRPAVAQNAPPAADLPPPAPAPVIPPPESVIMPPAEGLVESAWEECLKGRILLRGDYLLMQPRRRALDFAIVDPNTDGKPQGSIESLSLDSTSGLRIGGGYQLPNDGWEIGAYYTYLHSHTNQLLNAPTGGTLYATLTHPGFVDAVDSAAGFANLNYNVLDVELAHLCRVSDTFGVRLCCGGRFAWIDQDLSVFYNGQSAFQSQVTSPVNFDGAGLRFGAEGQWTIFRRLNLFAHGYGSLLAGDFRTCLHETNNAGASVITDVDERFRKMVPVAELGLGVAWQGDWLHLRVGYEMVNWFGLIDSPDFVHDYTNKLSRRTSDLSLDGLAVELGVDY